MLSIWLGGLGADWFYLSNGDAGYICTGIVKLFMIFVGTSFFSFCFAVVASDAKLLGYCCGACALISYIGGPIWWLVDWIRILCDSFPSADGVYPIW